MLVKIGKYRGFRVYRRSYLVWRPVKIGGREKTAAKTAHGMRKKKRKSVSTQRLEHVVWRFASKPQKYESYRAVRVYIPHD